MALPTKEALGAKLLDYPLLRQLVFERWFRLAFAIFVLVFVFLGLFLPKIWMTSKPGFVPVIKVRGLDLVQAWSLRRTALKAAAEGRFDEADLTWQRALAHNRADPELVRGALRNILRDPHGRQRGAQAVQESFWLLRLTGTNVVDLELAAQVLEQVKYYDPVVSLVEPKLDQLTPTLAAVYLKALFNLGRTKLFDARWTKFHDRLPIDPELPLYRAAYLVGWGPPATMTDARQQLEAATQDPALRVLAYRLKLVLSASEMNPTEYGKALKQLEEWHEDLLSQHAGYWRLLNASGRKAEAMQLAQDCPLSPATPFEAAELAQTFWDLGLRDQALLMLQRYSKDYGRSPIFWVTYGGLLMDANRWEELRNVALQIRDQDGMRDALGGFSYFLDGRAELAQQRSGPALEAFKKAAEREFLYPTLGHRVAGQLFELGHADLARQILARLEKALNGEAPYWVLVFQVADQLKDVDLLVQSARRAYQLAPNDPAIINNYAAALIITRQSPQEVIRITLPLFNDNPNLLPAVVNHSAALLLNGRPKEAEALLKRVQTSALNQTQLALYNLDLFETYLSLRQYDSAWSVSDKIETDRLYPTQRRWLEQARQQLPPRQKQG